MAFEYVDLDTARARDGLRMVVVSGVPSAWGEAAKGILHVKGIDWAAVRLDYDSDGLKQWAGQRSGPVAIHGDERPRAGWAEILFLAERLAPEPALLPSDAAGRALVMGMSHEIVGEEGLCWSRRIELVHAGLAGGGGFLKPVARYLGRKYGYTPQGGEAARVRIASLLVMFADRLRAQRAAGSGFLVGDRLTAADIYLATAMAMFAPLPREVCAMDETMRAAFATLDPTISAALDPILIEHRDRIYADWLELPLRL